MPIICQGFVEDLSIISDFIRAIIDSFLKENLQRFKIKISATVLCISSLLTILTKWPHLPISTQPSIYIPHIFLQCLQFPSHVVSQTSTIQFLFPLTEQLISFPFTSQLSCPSSPNVSPAFLHSFAFPPHFWPLTLTHHQLPLSLCPDDPHLSCQLGRYWPPALLEQALPANPAPPLSCRPAAVLTNSDA